MQGRHRCRLCSTACLPRHGCRAHLQCLGTGRLDLTVGSCGDGVHTCHGAGVAEFGSTCAVRREAAALRVHPADRKRHRLIGDRLVVRIGQGRRKTLGDIDWAGERDGREIQRL